MLLFVLLVAIVLLLGFVHVSTKYTRMARLINKIPGPPTVPIFGNSLQFHVPPVEINQIFMTYGDKYYPIYKGWFFHIPLVYLRHPDDLQILLSSTKLINKKFAYELLDSWLHTGLLTSGGEKWHQRRKILTPAFHFNILKKYLEITNEHGEKAVAEIKAEGKEIQLDILPYCSKHALNIICESAMGVVLDEKDVASKKYKAAVYDMGRFTIYRIVRPYIRDWMVPLMPKFNRHYKQVKHDLNAFTDKIVSERREYHRSTDYKFLNKVQEAGNSESDNVYLSKKKRLVMLDLLLAAENDGTIDDAGIKEEVATFIFEGHDTIAAAISFSLMLLAENEAEQEKARKEVEEIWNRKNGSLEMSDLQKMNYLDRCIKESIRLFPSVPVINRYITEDLQLKNFLIPKGSTVLIHFVLTHRDPHFWPNPMKFDPDRFLPDQVRNRHPFAYVPFSVGSRNCIGQKFAMVELKSFIARILYNFYLEPIDRTCDVKIQSDLVMRPNHPVYTKFVRIDRL